MLILKDKDLEKVRDIIDLISSVEIKSSINLMIDEYIDGFRNGKYKDKNKTYWRMDCVELLGALKLLRKLGYFRDDDYKFITNYLCRYGERKRFIFF